MIRSRLLWTVFAGVLILSFVGFLGPGGNCSPTEANTGNLAGTLNGKDISRREFIMARFFELGMQDPRELSDAEEETLRKRTWQRIAALQTAKELGLKADDSEIAAILGRDPAFQNNGVFSREQYRYVIQSQLRTDVQTFEEYLRQDLTLQRLTSLLEASAWVSPLESNDRIRNLTDVFKLEVAAFNANKFDPEINPEMIDIEDYYNRNAETLLVPEKIKIRVVEFPATNRIDAVGFSDDDIYDYYDANIETFRMEDSTNRTENAADTAAENTEETASSVPGYRPVEEVREQIISELQHQQALLNARDTATDFVIQLTPDRNGSAPEFEALAAAFERTVITTGWFSVTNTIPELMDVEDAVERAFALDQDNPLSSYSDPLTGSNSVYVISILDRREAYLPELSEIEDELRIPATEEMRRKLLREHVNELHDEILMALKEGKEFRSAAEQLELEVSTPDPFSVYDTIESTNQVINALSPVIMSLSEGQLSEAAETDDQLLLAYVAERRVGDPAINEMVAPQVLAALSRYRSGMVFDEWMQWNLANADWQDFMAPESGSDI